MTDYEIRELSFKGHPYKIACTNKAPQDPSHFSHEDESSVRDRDWDIKPGDVVFDIGSAYGSYALTALACGAEFVFCINPNNEENAVLIESLKLNGWSDCAKIFSGGIWSEDGHLRDTDLHFVDSEEAHEIDDKGRMALRDHFVVRRLDDVVGYFVGVDRLDWMKMDVEGAEEHVIRGAEQTIRKFKPRILVEQHRFKDATIAERVTVLLETFGYRLVRDTPYHAVSHSLYEPGEK